MSVSTTVVKVIPSATNPANITCSKLTIKALEKGVKSVQRQQ